MTRPSVDRWLEEAKMAPGAENCGMYLTHCGTVRRSAKAKVRQGSENAREVAGMRFQYDAEKTEAAISAAKALDGIYYVRVWLNEGILNVGDDIMLVLIGGDIRHRVVEALQFLVGRIKTECVTEEEIYK